MKMTPTLRTAGPESRPVDVIYMSDVGVNSTGFEVDLSVFRTLTAELFLGPAPTPSSQQVETAATAGSSRSW